MSSKEDFNLSLKDKLSLIEAIPKRQWERWARIRKWRHCGMPNNFRHLMIKNEVDLIRRQRERLTELKKQIGQ